MQCRIWVRELNVSQGRLETLQSLPFTALGGLQLEKNLPSHLRSFTGLLLPLLLLSIPDLSLSRSLSLSHFLSLSKLDSFFLD